MDTQRLTKILGAIRGVRVAVYGDFCLDAYWILDPRGSETSVETGLAGRAVARHYYTLGGAANVVANLAALEPAGIRAVGVVGDDIFGREMVRQLDGLGVDTRSMVVQADDYDTVTFGKPYLGDDEQARIDFGFRNRRSGETDTALLAALAEALEWADALIVNQQVPDSIPDRSFIERLDAMAGAAPDCAVLLDARHYGEFFANVTRKTNAVEAARLNGVCAKHEDLVSAADCRRHAAALYERSGRPVFITRGPRGSAIADRDGVDEIPGIQLLGQIDPVGAGDTATSALALCLGAGVSARQAAEVANIAAAVTVQKLFQTGTASPAEVLALGAEASYIYQPELAGDPRQARRFETSEIEVCAEPNPFGRTALRHAVFDHDGTISALRQGWEQVMVPVMMRAILGQRYESADETLYHRVRGRVVDYIDKSTGIQTLLQMEALVAMVREFGLVADEHILDKFGYKHIYNDALMELVSARLAKFNRAELGLEDITIKGAVGWLSRLRDKGVKLYLASGTDRADVIREAEALGYAELFDGGIYGALDDVARYNKKMVIEGILEQNGLAGPELAVFGDGPVEIRECRRCGGLAVGIASDEVRRHGLSPEKRARLIKAGAHAVVPDFSQPDALAQLLL